MSDILSFLTSQEFFLPSTGNQTICFIIIIITGYKRQTNFDALNTSENICKTEQSRQLSVLLITAPDLYAISSTIHVIMENNQIRCGKACGMHV